MHKQLGKSFFWYKIFMNYTTILRLLPPAYPEIHRLKNSNSDMKNKANYSTNITHIKFLIFNLFIPAVLTENILKVWDSHKTQLYCSQIGLRFLLIYWFDNKFRPIHLGHHQVYKMFIRVQVNYCLL